MSDFDKIAEKWAGLILDSGADDPVEGIKLAMEEAAESLEQQLTEEKKKNEELVKDKARLEHIIKHASSIILHDQHGPIIITPLMDFRSAIDSAIQKWNKE